MKTISFILIFAGLLAFSSCTEPQGEESVGMAKGKVANVSAQEFHELIVKQNGIILDVRTPGEIADGYIEGASFVNFYDDDFKDKIELMDKSKPIYTYCRSGGRSSKAAGILLKSGFAQVYNLKGGIGGWMDAKYPVVSTLAAPDNNIQELTLSDFHKLLNSPLPVLIDFHTTWCAPCKKMAPIIDRLQKLYAGNAKILRIDIDKSKAIGKAYNIKGVPVFVLFNAGEEKWRNNGILEEEKLREIINNAINNKKWDYLTYSGLVKRGGLKKHWQMER